MADYRKGFEIFSVAVLIRILLNSALLVFLANQRIAQAIAMLCVQVGYLTLLIVSPYVSVVAFRMDLLMVAINVVTIVFPIVLSFDPATGSGVPVSWVLLGLNAFVILAYSVYAITLLSRQIHLILTRRKRSGQGRMYMSSSTLNQTQSQLRPEDPDAGVVPLPKISVTQVADEDSSDSSSSGADLEDPVSAPPTIHQNRASRIGVKTESAVSIAYS